MLLIFFGLYFIISYSTIDNNNIKIRIIIELSSFFVFGYLASIYISHARNHPQPALSVGFLFRKSFGVWITPTIVTRTVIQVSTLYVFFLSIEAWGLNTVSASLILTCSGVGMALGRPLSGHINTALGPAATMASCMLGLALFILLFEIDGHNHFLVFISMAAIGTLSSIVYNGIHAAAYLLADADSAADTTVIVGVIHSAINAVAAFLAAMAATLAHSADAYHTIVATLVVLAAAALYKYGSWDEAMRAGISAGPNSRQGGGGGGVP